MVSQEFLNFIWFCQDSYCRTEKNSWIILTRIILLYSDITHHSYLPTMWVSKNAEGLSLSWFANPSYTTGGARMCRTAFGILFPQISQLPSSPEDVTVRHCSKPIYLCQWDTEAMNAIYYFYRSEPCCDRCCTITEEDPNPRNLQSKALILQNALRGVLPICVSLLGRDLTI